MVFGQNRAAMTGKVLPSGWLRVVRVEIYFVTINGSDEEGEGGKGRDVKRETSVSPEFAPYLAEYCGCFGKEVTDIGYVRNWI